MQLAGVSNELLEADPVSVLDESKETGLSAHLVGFLEVSDRFSTLVP